MISRHLSVVIAADPALVARLAGDPAQLPVWAAGLALADVQVSGRDITMDSPMGPVRVRFVPPNPHGVLDHTVTLPTGEEVLNPLRVVAHPDGAEVIFTVRQRDMTEADFTADCAAVAADLAALRDLIESGWRGGTAPATAGP